jgi:hypothetical protein
MSHSVHRRGTKDTLDKDFVLISLVTSRLKTFWTSVREKMRTLVDICMRYSPENFNRGKYYFQGCYSDSFRVKELIRDLKGSNLGLSVVLTGDREQIIAMAREMGLRLNSVHLSLGVFGDKSLLPEEKILEMTTMCGHHCISPALVKGAVESINMKRVDMEEAVHQISRHCVCNIFSRSRAKEIFSEMIMNK